VDTYNSTTAVNAIYFCKAAMCPEQQIQDWNCGEACSFHTSMENIIVYANSSTKTQGFTGYNAATNRIVVTFRGSSTALNWLEDFDFFLVDYPLCPHCKIHQGFDGTYKSMISQVIVDLNVLIAKYPNADNILITGHSLGAAISLLTGVELVLSHQKNESSIPPILFYTFGMPRVGNVEFAAYASSLLPELHRVTHHHDPVPRLPPLWLDSYRHPPHEIYYENDINGKYTTCNDAVNVEDKKCMISNGWALNGNDHTLYLGIDTHCVSKPKVDDDEQQQTKAIMQRIISKFKLH
jgi:hypothetical protein